MSSDKNTIILGGASLVGGVAAGYVAYRWWKKRSWNQKVSHLKGSSLLSVDSLSKEDIACVIELGDKCKDLVYTDGSRLILQDKVMAALFYEPSTRTRCSFEAAMKRLGGQVVLVDNMHTSSVSKGETLEDTVRMMRSYADVLVMRHPEKGAAKRALAVCDVPLLNAGDGTGEHPTQSMLDLYTIASFYPHILSTDKKITDTKSPLRVTFVGDLKNGRTVHSLAKVLARYNTTLQYVSPESLQLTGEFRDEISCIYKDNGFDPSNRQTVVPDLKQALTKSDVVYMTRVQKERFEKQEDYELVKDQYILTSSLLDRYAPPHCKILHPLPRVNEITLCVDSNPRQAYMQQAQNGLYVRMALLLLCCGRSDALI